MDTVLSVLVLDNSARPLQTELGNDRSLLKMCALPRVTLQDRMSPLRRSAALSGPVAGKGLRMWVYQAQAYERTGHLDSRWFHFLPPKENDA